LGWVWAPASSGVFKPGEVFWMRGAKVAAWGPLAPGEEWNPGNIPAQYAASNLTFAAYLAEAPAIDPASFAPNDKPKDALKAATFVAALPSLPIVPARLEAQRPLISVNALRVAPETQSEPPARVERAPRPSVIVTPPPATEEVLVPVPVYEGFIILGTLGAPGAPGKGSPRTQASSSQPAPKPVTIPAPLPAHAPRHTVGRPRDNAEDIEESKFQSDLRAARWAKALEDLDDWTKRYPQSKLTVLRFYDYMLAHSAMAHADRVLEYGALAMARTPAVNQGEGALDEQQTAGVLFLTMVNAEQIAKPSREQRALGAVAAQSLIEILPHYFQDDRRPAESTPEQWASSRQQLETAAREALKKLSGRPAA
jgi:hypothetical protein